jgi:succinyl-diaminopimelate desuccinylase
MDEKFNESIPVLQKMISIKSPYFEEGEVAAYICAWLNDNGVPAEIMEYQEDQVTNIQGKNVICRIEGGLPGPTIYLNGHMDTVQLCNNWTKNPYGGECEDGKIYGVGSLDMKSGCAAIMVAMKHFLAENKRFKGTIIASFVSDEEGPFGLGSDAVLNAGLADGADVSIVTEPSSGFTGTDFPCVCMGARGGYGMILEFFGKSAHAASPDLGVNAATEASKAVANLESSAFKVDELLGPACLCVIKFEADGGACSVPDYARVDIFRHIVRGETQASIVSDLERAIKDAGVKCEWKISFRKAPSEETEGFMPYVTDRDDPYVEQFFQSVKQVTGVDAAVRYFPSIGDYNYLGTRLNAPCLIFGAAGENFHSADEYATVDSLTGTTAVLYDYFNKMLKEE